MIIVCTILIISLCIVWRHLSDHYHIASNPWLTVEISQTITCHQNNHWTFIWSVTEHLSDQSLNIYQERFNVVEAKYNVSDMYYHDNWPDGPPNNKYPCEHIPALSNIHYVQSKNCPPPSPPRWVGWGWWYFIKFSVTWFNMQ